MDWVFQTDAPLYAQLVEKIQFQIASGAFPPGMRLPSVRELATDAGVNPNTMQRALAELDRSGLVFSQRTAGRFVTEDAARIEQTRCTLAQRQIDGFVAGMAQLGYEKEEILKLLAQTPAGKKEVTTNGNSSLQ